MKPAGHVISSVLIASLALLCLALAGCVMPTVEIEARTQDPVFVDYPMPVLSVERSWLQEEWFTEVDCSGIFTSTCLVPESPLAKLGCDKIVVDDQLGGFDPPYPVVECINLWNGNDGAPPNPEEYEQSCCGDYFSHVVYRNGQYDLLKGSSDFKAVFAPIESAEEAYSYAIAATGFSPDHDLHRFHEFSQRGMGRLMIDKIEDTHVDQTGEGFTINLVDWSDEPCNRCASYVVSMVDLLITKEGDVKILETTPIFQFEEACWDC